MELADIVPDLVRARREEGLTYEDALALALRAGVKVSLSKLWRVMRASGSEPSYGVRPRWSDPSPPVEKQNPRHRLWLQAKEAGVPIAAIARKEGVSRQAVHKAIAGLQGTEGCATP